MSKQLKKPLEESTSGYHLTNIPKGELGEWSKITEEWAEFEDAKEQGSKIMMMVELADVYGAIESFNLKYAVSVDASITCMQELDKVNEQAKILGITIPDLIIFSNITKRAFQNGVRK